MSKRSAVLMGVAWLAFLSAGASFAAAGADSDGDGIPDKVEKRLGTDPQRAEQFVRVFYDGVVGKDDKSHSRRYKNANDILACYAAHVGGRRFLIKATLAKPFVADNTVLHIYVDWDNDQTNGRQDNEWVRGCDVMYSTVNGRFGPRIFTPAVRLRADVPPREQIVGDTIYVCDDVKPKLAGGRAEFRIYILSHMADDTGDADTSGGWTLAHVPVDAARKAPELPYPKRAGFDLLPADWELVASVWHGEGTVWLKPSQAEVAGFRLQYDESVDATAAGQARVTFAVPKSGTYWVCCKLFRRACRFPGLDVAVNGQRIGTIAGGAALPDDMLAFSSKPVSLKAGDKLTFAVAENSGPLRAGMFMLSPRKPQMPPLRIENIQTWHMPDEPGKAPGRVLVTWRTNRVAECAVRYQGVGAEAFGQRGFIEPKPAKAHRCFYVVLPREQFGAARYRLRIEAREQPVEPYWKGQRAAASAEVDMSPPKPGHERPGEVRLTVRVDDNQKMPWPVRSGVPLPRGRLWDASRCRLIGPDGKPVDAQFIAWSRWPDYSIKWLIIDFVDDLPRNPDSGGSEPQQTYTLRYGVKPAPVSAAVSVRRAGGEIVAEGRRARVVLPSDAFLGEIWADRDGDGQFGRDEKLAAPRLVLTDADGKRYEAGPPDETTVMESGPVHAIVRRAGWFVAADGTKFFRYLVFLHLWRGLPRVYIEISLDNANVDQQMSRLTQLSLIVPVRGDKLLLAGQAARDLTARPVRLLQDYDNRFLINGQKAGRRFGGWTTVMSGRSPRLLLAVRDFWKLWPKGVRATDGEMAVDLLPQLPADAYQSKADQQLVDRLYFWCDGGKYKLRAGARITTDVLLDFAPPPQADAMAAEAARVDRPPFAAASPKYYCSSGAFGEIYPADGNTFARYDENMRWSFREFLRRRERVREYGFINYGDWWGERRWNWGNEEYDTMWALSLLFAHFGDLDMLHSAIAAARHNSDVDTVHYAKNPAYVGKLYYHCLGHTGGYFPPSWKKMGAFARGGWNYGHTWCTGQLTVAALTGSYRIRQSGLSIADEVTRTVTPRCYFYARDAGWTTIAMMSAYEATGNPWYLNGARLMVDRMLQKQNPETGRMGAHFLDPSECPHRPRHFGAKPFMTGIMLRGLRMYHQVEPREDVARAIVRCADWYWNYAWVPKDLGFWYSECPKFMNRGGPWTFCLAGDGLAYACLLDRQHFARRKELLKKACAGFLYRAGRSGFGKSFTQLSCCMLYALEWMRRLGITSVPAPPESKAEAPAVNIRSVAVLLPGRQRDVFPFVFNPSTRARRLAVEVRGKPDWLDVAIESRRQIGPGERLFIPVHIRPKGDAADGARGVVKLRIKVGALSRSRYLRVEVFRPESVGKGAAIITGEKDWLGPALARAGLALPPLREASWDKLRRLRAVVVGSEALLHDYGHIRRHLADLQRFVLAGGLLVVGQINDDGWDPGMLPLDIYLDEPRTFAERVLEPEHPLFRGIAPRALAGVISYDTVIWAAPGWRILMTDEAGRPAILEARVGRGRVVVIEPSFDRVTAETAASRTQGEGCVQFIKNVAALLQATG